MYLLLLTRLREDDFSRQTPFDGTSYYNGSRGVKQAAGNIQHDMLFGQHGGRADKDRPGKKEYFEGLVFAEFEVKEEKNTRRQDMKRGKTGKWRVDGISGF